MALATSFAPQTESRFGTWKISSRKANTARNLTISCVAMLVPWLPLVNPVLAQDVTAEFEAWTVDPLIKVFRDDMPIAAGEAAVDVAGGEHATFQVVVRSEKPLQDCGAK